MKLPGLDKLGSVGLVGERKAISLLCLGFYTTLFFMLSLSARTELPEWLPVFSGLALVYTTAFFAVAAEWFWGRWFATGLGYWGLTMAVMAFVATRSLPAPMVVFGIMHGLISICLAGEKMAGLFDAKPAWREKWKVDEQGVIRVRKSVTRAASSLPALIMFALAPREGADFFSAGFDVTSWGLGLVAVLCVIGFFMTRKVWTLIAMSAVGVAILVKGIGGAALYSSHSYFDPAAMPHASCALQGLGIFAGAALIAASLPFVGPMAAFVLRGRRV
jgi:hypothetical protein